MLNVTFKTGNSYVIGEEISVEVEVVNVGNEDSSIHIPISSSGKLYYDIFSLKRDDTRVVYHGMLVKTKDFRVPIKIGENISFNIDLTREYLINKNGNYALSFNEDYFDSQYYTPSEVSINIEDKELQPITTWYQISTASKKIHPSAFKAFGSHKAYYATDVQFNDLKQAHYKAIEILEKIEKSHNQISKNFQTPYQEMFCKNDTSMWPSVYSNMTHMKQYMDYGLKYHFRGEECNPGVYAYVFPADTDKNIYLCEQYNEAEIFPTKLYPYDTKSGTIIHEVSHKAVNSKDHFYSYDNCKAVASLCIVDNTTTNADCLQIFSELCYLSGENSGIEEDL